MYLKPFIHCGSLPLKIMKMNTDSFLDLTQFQRITSRFQINLWLNFFLEESEHNFDSFIFDSTLLGYHNDAGVLANSQ